MNAILGWAMLAVSLAGTCYALPRQILVNHLSKTVPAGYKAFFALSFASYTLRMAYTAGLNDWLTALAALPGALCSGVLLTQQYAYRRNHGA